MFSGIVEATAKVVNIAKEQTNRHFTFEVPFANELNIDQSIAHNGVCLTVVRLIENASKQTTQYVVTAMDETLKRTNLGNLQLGDKVNVERSMPLNGRLDGHIVQGHVDQTAECISVKDVDGSYVYTFKYKTSHEEAAKGYFCVEKGSITVNGVSLTVCEPTDNTFKVNIIPYTYKYTNFHTIHPGTKVNIEFDILGKYIARLRHFENE